MISSQSSEGRKLERDERAVKLRELEARRLEAEKALAVAKAPSWRRADPLVLAIIVAIFTIIGNTIVAYYNNRATIEQQHQKAGADLDLENLKAKYNLVLQAIATNNEKTAQRNINFFINAGLLEDRDGKIQNAATNYLPVLPGQGVPNGESLTVPSISQLYNFPSQLDGAEQTIGILEFGGGLNSMDIDKYFSDVHLSKPNISPIYIDNEKNDTEDIGSSAEVSADTEIVGAIAPKARIRVYFAPFTAAGFSAAISTAMADHVSVLLCAWGMSESEWKPEDITTVNNVLKRAATMGVTIVVSAGDDGVTSNESDNKPHVAFPASSPWVLAVGGTSMVLSSGQLQSEVAWKQGTGLRADGGGSTGGGVSETFEVPDWQAGVAIPELGNGRLGRGVPDVAAVASSSVLLRVAGEQMKTGGTDVSASIWAGLIGLLNQGVGQDLGYFNPRLYRDIGPAQILRPVTSGDNGVRTTAGYVAGLGWNAVTGWGTPDGEKLLTWLRAHPSSGVSQ
jgi:kumamolisin